MAQVCVIFSESVVNHHDDKDKTKDKNEDKT